MRVVRGFLAALATAWLIGSMLALSACNTVEGMGRDIRNAGQWIEEKADGSD